MRPLRASLFWIVAIFFLFPLSAQAATTSTVYVLLKNGGVGNFDYANQVKVFANADYNAYDKSTYIPRYSWEVIRPGDVYEARFSNLYVYSGWQGTYKFEVSFRDSNFTKHTVVIDNVRFPYANRTYYVSKLGVTTYRPSSFYALEMADDGGNSAPEAVAISNCYPDYPNPESSIYVYWSLSLRPSDYST